MNLGAWNRLARCIDYLEPDELERKIPGHRSAWIPTSDGLPYLVMELIAGAPVTTYVHEHDLPIEQRLPPVSKSLRSGPIRPSEPGGAPRSQTGEHPGDRRCVPKLLDFGIARLLTPIQQDTTATRMAAWTPDYASPEQVLGRLVLFEILTGDRVPTADTMSASALERLVCQTELPRASSKAPRHIACRIAGDLDTIVAKATQKDPWGRAVSRRASIPVRR